MSDPRLRVLEILGEVVDLAPSDRKAALDRLCGDDEKLRREIEELLALEETEDDFLEKSPLAVAPEASAEDDRDIGRRLGPYRLTELLGRGGMGSVYLAVREDDYEQQVAVKLIRSELAGGEPLRRFHAERQILARFEHPSIARLLDGGTTEDGRPYLVMEYVDGVPLRRWCVEHRPSVGERIELFREILSAVAYAHRNLVVHRDLKPANILVAADGVPKLLDFGIAKLLDPDDSQATPSGSSAMTPRYASPEQIDGLPITTASDVYSLGVVLYEMLVGKLPCGLDKCTPHEIAGRICTEEPTPPSRETTSRKLSRRLAGDLDVIVLKALQKNPADRYSSVEQLSGDLHRHLEGLPIYARRDAWLYRMGKLVRRHRLAAAAILLIFASSIVSMTLWSLSVKERKRSERVDSLMRVFTHSVHLNVAQGRELTAREILEDRFEQLDRIEQDDPELAAMLANAHGTVYRNLGDHAKAKEFFQREVSLRRVLNFGSSEKLVQAINDLSSCYYYLGQGAEAVKIFREALDQRRRLGQEPTEIARGLSNLASALKLQGELDEAAHLYEEALAIREELFGAGSRSVASSLYGLGVLYFEIGKLERSEAMLRRALRIRIEKYGRGRTQVATIESSLSRTLHFRGMLGEAEELKRRALATRTKLYDEGHVQIATARRDLAAILLDRGDQEALEEGRELIEAAVASLRRSRTVGDRELVLAEDVFVKYSAVRGKGKTTGAFHKETYEASVAARRGS